MRRVLVLSSVVASLALAVYATPRWLRHIRPCAVYDESGVRVAEGKGILQLQWASPHLFTTCLINDVTRTVPAGERLRLCTPTPVGELACISATISVTMRPTTTVEGG